MTHHLFQSSVVHLGMDFHLTFIQSSAGFLFGIDKKKHTAQATAISIISRGSMWYSQYFSMLFRDTRLVFGGYLLTCSLNGQIPSDIIKFPAV
jgi:hypothetical protein